MWEDSLWFLNLSNNLLTHMEQIPWKRTECIDLSSNQLQGYLPVPPPSSVQFLVSNNQLVGVISSMFCDLSLIEVLDLSNNNLTGRIPPCSQIYSHKLSAVMKENSLRILNLRGNQLEGPLPHFFFNCEKLEILDVADNKLNGSFPYWLESLPELQVLILRSNRFQGPISNPKVRFPLRNLRVMDLSNNKFTGLLPEKYFKSLMAMVDAHTDVLEYTGEYTYGDSYYSVTITIKGNSIEMQKIQKMFMTIDFSSNNFTGEIPHTIGKLNSLKGLNFSHNNLYGLIPPSLGNLSSLEWLGLSSKKLSGNIPLRLATDLNQLAKLNLSNNKLEGAIPRGKQFNTFDSDSYSGNPALCGFPLPKSCSNDEAQHDHETKMIDWNVVMMGYGSGVVIGISIGYMVLFSRSCDYWFLKRFGRRRSCGRRARSRVRRRSN